MFQISSPRRTVIHRHSFWQSITPEGSGQLSLHGLGLLIQACLQTHYITRVIIQNRKRVTRLLICRAKPTFKVHLPELIRSFVLEPLPSLMFLRFHRIDYPVSLQNPVNRAMGWNFQLVTVHQNTADLPCTPTRVLGTYSKNLLFNRCCRSCRRLMRSSRLIPQPHLAFGPRSLQPLVKRLRAHLKPPTQFADICPRLRGQSEYLFSKRHGLLHLGPGHSMSPPYIESPYVRCYPCLGTCVTYVSGPYR